MREKKKATNKPGTNTHAKLKTSVQASTRLHNAAPSSTASMHHADAILGNVAMLVLQGESMHYTRSRLILTLSKTPFTQGQPKQTVRFLDRDSEALPTMPVMGIVEHMRAYIGVAELENMAR